MGKYRKGRLIGMLMFQALLSCFMAGLVNMKLQTVEYSSGRELGDRLSKLSLYSQDYGNVYSCKTSDEGYIYVTGVKTDIIKKTAWDALYEGNSPYLYKYIVPKHISEYAVSVYKALMSDVRCFPVAEDVAGNVEVSYEDSWGNERNYGGKRMHEGTDIMAGNNLRGYFPVLSMTDGVIENMGWLKLGGYRIGIRSPSGAYYYYAHLCEYADGLAEGMNIKAGTIIGTMGDTGYSDKEGTTGNFPVHLHVGIYYGSGENERAYNPYYILKSIERYKREFI